MDRTFEQPTPMATTSDRGFNAPSFIVGVVALVFFGAMAGLCAGVGVLCYRGVLWLAGG